MYKIFHNHLMFPTDISHNCGSLVQRFQWRIQDSPDRRAPTPDEEAETYLARFLPKTA